MRTLLIGVIISIAVTALSQDHGTEAIASGVPVRDFEHLEPFVRGLALSNREVTIYRVRTKAVANHSHSKPIVIVWTKEAVVTEQKGGEASASRSVSVGQIDVYPSGTIHSLRAVKGSLHFTLIELKQSLRDPKGLPNKPAFCERVVEFPQGGFACLIKIALGQQITIPKLDVNSFLVAIDSARVSETIPRHRWDAHYREGSPGFLTGYEEHGIQNLEPGPLQFALIVPPPAEYN